MADQPPTITTAKRQLIASWLSKQLDQNCQFENNLFDLIDTVVDRCTNQTVQPCRQLIVKLFNDDIKELLDYLLVLSKAQPTGKRLYILYLLNDTLHHAKVSGTDCSCQFSALFHAAWEEPTNHERLTELVELWRQRGYLDTRVIDTMWQERAEQKLPESLSLGAIDQPFYMLPASLMVPHIKGSQPIDPDLVQPVLNLSISSSIEKAIAEFDSDLKEEHKEKYTYYGWTHEFANKYNIEQLEQCLEPATHPLPKRLNAYPPPASYD